MLVAAVCVTVVLLALALLVVPVLRLWRQTKALARTVADAGDRLAAVTAHLDPVGSTTTGPVRRTAGPGQRGTVDPTRATPPDTAQRRTTARKGPGT